MSINRSKDAAVIASLFASRGTIWRSQTGHIYATESTPAQERRDTLRRLHLARLKSLTAGRRRCGD